MLKSPNYFYFFCFFSLISVLPYLDVAGLSGAKTRAQPSPEIEATGVNDTKPPDSQGSLTAGTEAILNGKTINLPWMRWQEGNSIRLGVGDTSAEAILGIELLSTNQETVQPIRWFNYYERLGVKFVNPYRYIDITALAKTASINLEVIEGQLKIDIPPTRVTKAYTSSESKDRTIVVELERPTFWQVSQSRNTGIIKIEGEVTPALLGEFQRQQPGEVTLSEDEDDPTKTPKIRDPESQLFFLENKDGQATITINIPPGSTLKVNSGSPNLLLINLKPDAIATREIQWLPEILWQQKYVPLPASGSSSFLVSFLTLDLNKFKLELKPITTDANQMAGTNSLLKTARGAGAIAAINGGFFNRNNQLPLGAIKSNGKWLSGPILNRGAIAWNSVGKIKIGRLKLQETLSTFEGDRFVLENLNSGYLQPGIARYTPEWGLSYRTLSDREIIAIVEGNEVKEQIVGEKAGEDSINIPKGGYLLALRKAENLAARLKVGTKVKLDAFSLPGEFDQYANILGAGPVLLLNRQVVLDGEAEGFSKAFNQQKASRSAIATTSDGKVLLVAVHQRVGGGGPTLSEFAQILQNLGAVDALNLDGGSSTQIYLGGQIVDRSAASAARVHNGIGIFLSPSY